MENNNDSQGQAVDAVVTGLKNDFKIVGSHRVHSWYAWAIIGIVFGLALGVVYVANRSGNFQQSDASQTGPKDLRFICPGTTQSNHLDSQGSSPIKLSASELKAIKSAMSSDGKSIDEEKITDGDLKDALVSAKVTAANDCENHKKQKLAGLPNPLMCKGACGAPTVQYPAGIPSACQISGFKITGNVLTITAHTIPNPAPVIYTCDLPPTGPAQPNAGGSTGPGTPGGDNEGGPETPSEKSATEPTTEPVPSQPGGTLPSKPIRR